jgi:hypothetical protein
MPSKIKKLKKPNIELNAYQYFFGSGSVGLVVIARGTVSSKEVLVFGKHNANVITVQKIKPCNLHTLFALERRIKYSKKSYSAFVVKIKIKYF